MPIESRPVTRCRKRTDGFTLIELIISIVVISAAVAGVMLLTTTTVARSGDPMVQTQAIYIAQAYLEEALLRPYAGDPDCTGPRDRWQAVQAYDCIAGEAPSDQLGNALGLPSYSVSMAVTPTTLGGVAARKVEVSVTHAAQPINITLTGYVAQY